VGAQTAQIKAFPRSQAERLRRSPYAGCGPPQQTRTAAYRERFGARSALPSAPAGFTADRRDPAS